MEMQLKYVTKEQAHKMIDEIKGNTIAVLSYNGSKGVSDKFTIVKKNQGKRMVDKSDEIALSENDVSNILSLYKLNNCKLFNRGNIVKTVLLPKLE